MLGQDLVELQKPLLISLVEGVIPQKTLFPCFEMHFQHLSNSPSFVFPIQQLKTDLQVESIKHICFVCRFMNLMLDHSFMVYLLSWTLTEMVLGASFVALVAGKL